jgi:tRNA(fMet)-specific endonuclease VapC
MILSNAGRRANTKFVMKSYESKILVGYQHLIQRLNQRSPKIIQKLTGTQPDEIAVCSVVKAELFLGAAKSNTPTKTLAKQEAFFNRFVSLPFDDKAASIYGPMRGQLEQRGTPIGPLDMLIAAIALANDLILVTHNTAEFGRVAGLKIEDWEVRTKRFFASQQYISFDL